MRVLVSALVSVLFIEVESRDEWKAGMTGPVRYVQMFKSGYI